MRQPVCALLLALSLLPLGTQAQEPSDLANRRATLFSDLELAERRSRLVGGSVSTGLGALLVTAPLFTDSLSSAAKATFVAGGALVLIGSVRMFFEPTLPEQLARTLYALRSTPELDAKTRLEYERQLIAALRRHARSQRYWNSAVGVISGTTLLGLATQTNGTARVIYQVTGGAAIFGGVMGLLIPSRTEVLIDQYGDPEAELLFTHFNGGAAIGVAAHF